MLPTFDRALDAPDARAVRALLCCPLQVGRAHCNGAVVATHKRVGNFTRADEALLKALCAQAPAPPPRAAPRAAAPSGGGAPGRGCARARAGRC
jgi:hypothetical protein